MTKITRVTRTIKLIVPAKCTFFDAPCFSPNQKRRNDGTQQQQAHNAPGQPVPIGGKAGSPVACDVVEGVRQSKCDRRALRNRLIDDVRHAGEGVQAVLGRLFLLCSDQRFLGRAQLSLGVIPDEVLQPRAVRFLEQTRAGIKVREGVAFADHGQAPLFVPPQGHRKSEGEQRDPERHAGVSELGPGVVARLRGRASAHCQPKAQPPSIAAPNATAISQGSICSMMLSMSFSKSKHDLPHAGRRLTVRPGGRPTSTPSRH